MKLAGVLAAAVLLYGSAQSNRFYVTSAAATLVEQGLASAAPAGADASAFQEVPAPGIQFRPSQAQATLAPWVTSNGWRFQRGVTKANYARLPAGSAALAAAEAFTYGVEAILNPEPADVEDLGRMLRFLQAHEQPALPVMANIAVVDDRSPEISEFLNLLTRRNLLYRVMSAPDRTLVTVQLGTDAFPRESAKNPSDLAARVREKVGDDNRLVRVYGTNTAIVHLTGTRERARLFVLAYGGNRRRPARDQQRDQQNVRLRVLGRYTPASFAAFGAAADAALIDVENPGNTTEFSLPPFSTFALINLNATK
jgi:hypothetical protein